MSGSLESFYQASISEQRMPKTSINLSCKDIFRIGKTKQKNYTDLNRDYKDPS